MKEKLLTVKETSELTRIAESTLSKHRIKGEGPSYLKLGGRVFYRQSDIDIWLNRSLVTPSAGV